MDPSISLRAVTIERGRRRVVDKVDLDVPGPGITVIGGANGSGKSTLLQAIAALRPIAGGQILIKGRSLADRSGRNHARRLCGYLPQAPRFPKQFSVEEFFAYAAWLSDLKGTDRFVAIDRALERSQLGPLRTAKLGRLSGGQQQRAYVAGAAIADPEVLLLDEPTVGIDAEHRIGLRAMLAGLADGSSIVLSSHLAEDFELLADAVVIMDNGRIVFAGDVASFLDMGGAEPIGRTERALVRLSGATAVRGSIDQAP